MECDKEVFEGGDGLDGLDLEAEVDLAAFKAFNALDFDAEAAVDVNVDATAGADDSEYADVDADSEGGEQ